MVVESGRIFQTVDKIKENGMRHMMTLPKLGFEEYFLRQKGYKSLRSRYIVEDEGFIALGRLKF